MKFWLTSRCGNNAFASRNPCWSNAFDIISRWKQPKTDWAYCSLVTIRAKLRIYDSKTRISAGMFELFDHSSFFNKYGKNGKNCSDEVTRPFSRSASFWSNKRAEKLKIQMKVPGAECSASGLWLWAAIPSDAPR